MFGESDQPTVVTQFSLGKHKCHRDISDIEWSDVQDFFHSKIVRLLQSSTPKLQNSN